MALTLSFSPPQALNISDHYPVEVELSLSLSQAGHGSRPLSPAALLLSPLLLLLLPPQLGLGA